MAMILVSKGLGACEGTTGLAARYVYIRQHLHGKERFRFVNVLTPSRL